MRKKQINTAHYNLAVQHLRGVLLNLNMLQPENQLNKISTNHLVGGFNPLEK